jgi:hypothetical protein
VALHATNHLLALLYRIFHPVCIKVKNQGEKRRQKSSEFPKFWVAVAHAQSAPQLLGFTALCAQTQTKKFFERVAKQPFQKISCGLFDQKLL